METGGHENFAQLADYFRVEYVAFLVIKSAMLMT